MLIYVLGSGGHKKTKCNYLNLSTNPLRRVFYLEAAMSSLIVFILSILAMALCVLFYVFRSVDAMKAYFKTPEGKKVAGGIIGFVLFGVLTALVSQAFAEEPDFQYLSYGKVYIGLDVPREQSPQCKSGLYNDRITSNGGIVINLVQSRDRRFETNFKYTHHSCAFNSDQNGYDAVGISLEYKLW
jgi:hypothetical protein